MIKVLYDQEIYLIKFRELPIGKAKPSAELMPGIISEKQTFTKNKKNKKMPDEMSKNSIILTNK